MSSDHLLGEILDAKMRECTDIDTHFALGNVYAEIQRARAKFPGNRFLLTALMEEVGELAQAYLQNKPHAEIREEAKQVACVAVRIMTEGDAVFDSITEAESQP